MPLPSLFLAPACVGNPPTCLFANAVLTAAGIAYGKAKSRQEARAATKESAADAPVDEETREIALTHTAVEMEAFLLDGDFLRNWDELSAEARVAHPSIHLGDGGSIAGGVPDDGKAMVPIFSVSGVRVFRCEAREATKESAAARLVDEEMSTSKALTVVPKVREPDASPLHADSLPNWADFFANAGVTHLPIHLGKGGARVWDYEGASRAMVPFVRGNGVGGAEVGFSPSGGGCLPGRGVIAGASGSSVDMVVVPFAVGMRPAVDYRTWDVEQLGPAVVVHMGSDGV